MINARRKGFTLIELVITMIVLVIIATVAVRPLIEFDRLWRHSTSKFNLLWDARAKMEDLSKNIRMIKDATSVTTANSTRFQFTRTDGTSINYQYASGVLQKNSVNYITNLSAFNFTYYDAANPPNVILTPLVYPTNTNIRSVKVNYIITNNEENLESSFMVYCRNLK